MRLLFMGPQASGKGTQAKIISKKLEIPHISTGDLLRNVEGELKEEIDSYMNQGMLYPDEGMIRILKERFKEDDTDNGFILDGFPRNLKQAEMLDEITEIDKVVEIHVDEERTIQRILNRLNCPNCGALFNAVKHKPKVENICDDCGSGLIKRKDDTEEAIRKRLDIYERDTKPVLEHYKGRVVRVDGGIGIKNVTEAILEKLKV